MSEELPATVVALLGPIPYLSTACETAHAIANCQDLALPQALAAEGLPSADELTSWHHQRCRRTHKFVGTPCRCACHAAP